MWKYYALLSALFAALTAVFAKAGVKNVNPNLATAVRTCVVLLLAWGIVFATGDASEIRSLTRRNIVFLVLSGAATGLSWIFYFKAVACGDVSRVAPLDKLSVVLTMVLAFVIFHETVTWQVAAGGLLITAGSLLIAFSR